MGEISAFRARASIPMSTTERDKCGLSSLLPMSCRDRAETFARHLHSRLRSLGSQDGSNSADESSWLAAHETPMAVSHQPRHTSDSELYFNFNLLESPSSPEEEITENEFMKLINSKDNLKIKNGISNFSYPNAIITNSHDSDSSDGPYYDTESDQRIPNTYMNGIPEDDPKQLDKVFENHVHESPPRTPTEKPPENHINDSIYESPLISQLTELSPNFTEEESTLSLRDEDFLSLDCNSTFQDLPEDTSSKSNEEASSEQELYSSNLNVEKDLTVECPLASVELSSCQEEIIKETRAFLEIESSNNDDELDKEEPTPRVRRCSSLKTGKTPPGTPGRKKIVRFADVLGLDLADVRTFLDEIPKIPISAYEDLTDADIGVSASDSSLNLLSSQKFHPSAGQKAEKILLPLFQQPGGQPNFLDKVREKDVCLENAVVNDPIDLSIKGIVRVRNLDFHKSVHIRYTLDSWKTYADLQASYVQNSCDGFSDTFSFLLYAHTLTIGQKLEFAVRYHCKGYQYWDNNYGANYCFQCLPASNNMAFITNGHYDDHWGASFY